MLLQELLRQVLEVALGHRHRRRHLHLALRRHHLHVLTQHTSLPLHLDAILQELRQRSDIHDAISDRRRAVNRVGTLRGSRGTGHFG